MNDRFATAWPAQKLTDFLAGVNASQDEQAALAAAAELAADGLDAEIGLVSQRESLLAIFGMRADAPAVVELVRGQDGTTVTVPALGPVVVAATPLDDGRELVVARRADDPFNSADLSLLRSMGRVLSMALTSLRRLVSARLHEANTQAVIRSALDCIISIDAAGVVTEWNHAAEATFGYTRDEAIGSEMAELIVPERLRDAHRAGLARFLQTGEGPVIDTRIEISAIRRDGIEIPVELGITVVPSDRPSFTAYLRDISDRVAAAQRIQATTERLSALVENLNAAVLVENEDRTIGLVNARYCEVFECPVSPDQLIGLSCAEAASRSAHMLVDSDGFRTRTDEIFAAGEPVFNEMVHFLDGRVFERDHIPISVTDEKFGRLWVYRDITSRIESERELQTARDDALTASRLKSSFLATMSHEIRTPMNGVVGLVELLAASPLDSDQQDLIRMLNHSADHLMGVIDDILDFSRIESGELRLEQIPFVPALTIGDVVELFRPKAAGSGITLNKSISTDLDDTFLSDPGRIRQIVQNLVGNAIKFTREGSVDVTAVLEITDPSGFVWLRVSVADTGIGIPDDVAKRLFEPFVQADASTNRLFGGSGLGLSICQRLAEMLGGAISVTSAPGSGSTFTLRLPLERAKEDHAAPAPRSATTSSDVVGCVLLVEDNPVNQAVVERQLRQLGHTVVIVGGGRDAVDYLAGDGPVDVVLMDCQMPGMDGFAATRAVRALGTERAQIPIIAMTANALSEDRTACLAAGMDDYLAKPTRSEDLQKALARWILVDPAQRSGTSARTPIKAVSVIDRSVMDGLVSDLGGDRSVLVEFIQIFLGELPGRLAAVHAELAGDDRLALRERAHALRSPSRALGLAQLDGVCDAIERSALNGNIAGARSHAAELDDAAAATAQALERIVTETS